VPQAAAESARVSTGVTGLDQILGGGFVRNGLYLLQGDPGAGKTTIALQFLLAGHDCGERGMYITLTESRNDLTRACSSRGWPVDHFEICDLTRNDFDAERNSQYIMFQPSEVEFGETARHILLEIERVGPSRVVFDGLSELRLLAPDPLRYRRQLLSLKSVLEARNVTVLLLDDRSSQSGHLDPESLVGGNVVLEKYLPGYGGARRRLHVSKVRGADFMDGYHDYEINREGVIVFPRLVASEHDHFFEAAELTSGIANLDRMLEGGLAFGTTTLLLGPAGVGKSTVAMQYVANALKHNFKAAVFTFDEVLSTLFARSEKLITGNVRDYVASGQLRAKQVNPAALSPGRFAQQVRALVEGGVRVVVIDSLNGYLSAMPDERFLTTHLHELFAYLNQKGVVTIMVVAQHGLVMPGSAELDVSYLADSVLLLRYFESNAQIRQAISVFKKRTGGHERSLRMLSITEQGLHVGEPLLGFHGVMTGVPEYGRQQAPEYRDQS
jgi:circadian clock protein KaiC